MPLRPKKLSKTLTPLDLEEPGRDVLTDVLGVSLLRNSMYRPTEARVPWGIRMPPGKRAMFYLIARGSALLEVEGEAPLELAASDVVFIPHGTAHVLRDAKTTEPQFVCRGNHDKAAGVRRTIGGTGAVTTIIAGFYELSDRPPPLLDRMPNVMLLSASYAASGVQPWVAATVQLVVAESAAPGPASPIVLACLADVLFVQALRSLTTTGAHQECRKHGLAGLGDPAVAQALGLMHARVEEPWTVAELAAKVGLSRSGFAARFAELVGEPPLQYLARWRISRAADLLRHGDDAIGVIAGRVGYESVPSFSKAFKRWQGVSPGAFRSGK